MTAHPMDIDRLAARITGHLAVLVEEIGPRPPGSPANRRATDHVRCTLASCGLDVREQPFEATWWLPGPAGIEIAGERIDLPPTPFGRPCDAAGPVLRLASDEDLASAMPAPGAVVVLDGLLSAEPYFPKAFPFLEIPGQRARLALLEGSRPAAVVAVVRDAGPYAAFEDGDLTFPYLAVPEAVGDRLVDGDPVRVRIGGRLDSGPGVNVSGRSGGDGPRTVISAHVDSKVTGPGAFDNAGGVATVLALAEEGLPDGLPVELVLFNGEDHYAAPGEQAWLAATELAEVTDIVNVDGAGVTGRASSAVALAASPAIEKRLAAAVGRRPGWELADPWYQSDHAIFAMRGIPSLAIASAGLDDLLMSVAHTERDTLDIVDARILADVAAFVADWVAGRS
jgi:aminopeptidase YwaD